jgi:hypothetical protein
VSGDEWADENGNPMFGSERTKPVTIPSIDPATATNEQRLAWCKERAYAEHWQYAIASIVSDMNKVGLPLNPDLYHLGMGLAVVGGARGVREFIDRITLASVARPAEAGDAW